MKCPIDGCDAKVERKENPDGGIQYVAEETRHYGDWLDNVTHYICEKNHSFFVSRKTEHETNI